MSQYTDCCCCTDADEDYSSAEEEEKRRNAPVKLVEGGGIDYDDDDLFDFYEDFYWTVMCDCGSPNDCDVEARWHKVVFEQSQARFADLYRDPVQPHTQHGT